MATAKKADNITDTDVLEAPQSANEGTQTIVPIPAPEVLEKDSVILLLSNDKRKGHVSLNLEEDVIDPDSVNSLNPKGNVRRMRLLRGAQSIWLDEQDPEVYPQRYVDKNTLDLHFDAGRCIIPMSEGLMVKAALISNRNVDNPYKRKAKDISYKEWDAVAQSKVGIAHQQKVIKAMQLAATAPYNEMVAHASYLGLPKQDSQGVPFAEESLRQVYMQKAMDNAEKFLNTAENPAVKIKHKIQNAVHKGTIDLGTQPNCAYWADGGFICTLPEGRDAVDYLVEYASVHGEANAQFANQLNKIT